MLFIQIDQRLIISLNLIQQQDRAFFNTFWMYLGVPFIIIHEFVILHRAFQ